MRKLRLAIVFWLAIDACGCGGDDTRAREPVPSHAGAVRICDGSTDLRFGTWGSVDPSRVAAGSTVFYELGSHWLYIDGQCRYWAHVNNVFGDDWRPVRQGILTPSDDERISTEFRYGEWPSLAKVWVGNEGSSHPSSLLFYNGQLAVECVGCCQAAPSSDEGFQTVCDISRKRFDLVAELYSRGQDVSGPIRLRAYPGVDPSEADPIDHTPESITAIEWPLAEPLEDVALTWEEIGYAAKFGDSYMVTDPDAVAAFRLSRDKFLSGALGPTFYNVMVVTPRSSAERYFLYFRDAIPLENARGMVFE